MYFTVLSCGHDSLLLKTRDLILSHDGFRVINTTDATEACHLLTALRIDLLLLCHTLSEQELQSVMAVAHALQPPPSVLTLAAHTFSSLWPAKNPVFDICDGPGKLLAALHGLIDNSRGAASRHEQNNGAELCRNTEAQ